MEEENKVETAGTTPETITQEPSQTPVQAELEREKGKTVRTEAEKAAFALQKNAERAKELGIDPAEVLGLKRTQEPVGTVVTVEMLEAREKEKAHKSALQMAEEISDEHERELTKNYLKNRIVPSGDPNEDLRFARLAVNSVKSGQIAEELARGGTARTHVSGAGAPPKQVNKEPELDATELAFTRPPWNMTKAQIIAKRPQ